MVLDDRSIQGIPVNYSLMLRMIFLVEIEKTASSGIKLTRTLKS